jgi:predicted short-subunit dehydrogenase-like oxidoreductase (DUF2520 family)
LIGQRSPRVGFVGTGKVGSALAAALHAAGYNVSAVASRRFASADALAARVPGCTAYETPQAVVEDCDLVFLTVPDAAIEPVAASLRWRRGAAAVHTSGIATRAALAGAARQGAATASLHPLQTFAGAAVELSGCCFAVEAEAGLRVTLLSLVESLGGRVVELRAEDKALYHAAAVLGSNYVVTLLALATDLWLRLGVERAEGLRALLPLLKGAVANLESAGLPGALTGPIARGDAATVELHLRALAQSAPEAVEVYRALGLQTLPLALAQGTVDEMSITRIRELLESRAVAADRGGG